MATIDRSRISVYLWIITSLVYGVFVLIQSEAIFTTKAGGIVLFSIGTKIIIEYMLGLPIRFPYSGVIERDTSLRYTRIFSLAFSLGLSVFAVLFSFGKI